MTESGDSRRVAFLDALRGCLSLLVVVHHVVCAFHSAALGGIARLAVTIFFVMSGFVLARGFDGRAAAFILRRFVRLWPTYAFAITVGYFLIGSFPPLHVLFWFPMLAYVAVPAVDHPAWTLYYEAWAVPFLIPAMIVARRSRTAALLLVPASACLVFIDQRFSCAPLFAIGIAASRFDIAFPSRLPPVSLWLGKISYSLYVTHGLVLSEAYILGGSWTALAAFPLTLFVAWGVWWAIERPSIRLSRVVVRINAFDTRSLMPADWRAPDSLAKGPDAVAAAAEVSNCP